MSQSRNGLSWYSSEWGWVGSWGSRSHGRHCSRAAPTALGIINTRTGLEVINYENSVAHQKYALLFADLTKNKCNLDSFISGDYCVGCCHFLI